MIHGYLNGPLTQWVRVVPVGSITIVTQDRPVAGAQGPAHTRKLPSLWHLCRSNGGTASPGRGGPSPPFTSTKMTQTITTNNATNPADPATANATAFSFHIIMASLLIRSVCLQLLCQLLGYVCLRILTSCGPPIIQHRHSAPSLPPAFPLTVGPAPTEGRLGFGSELGQQLVLKSGRQSA